METTARRRRPASRLSVHARADASSTLTLRAGTQLTDAGDALRSRAWTAAAGGGSGQSLPRADPFREPHSRRSPGASRAAAPTSRLGVDFEREPYETQTQLDRDASPAIASIDRAACAAAVDLTLHATCTDEEFRQRDSESTRDRLRRIARPGSSAASSACASTLDLYRARRHRRAGEYDENRAFLTRLPIRGGSAQQSARMSPRSPGYVNAMTVDVEDYFHVSALAESISRDDWATMEFRAERSTDRLLEMFDAEQRQGHVFRARLGHRSAPPQLIRRIHAAGHEVACHGLTHELVYRQTPEVFRDETRDSKAMLEDTIGAPVIGYRAASYSITAAIAVGARHPVRARLQLRLEHLSDRARSLRHSGRVDAARADRGAERPRASSNFRCRPSGVFGVRVPVAGGGYFRLLPYWFTRWALRSRQPNDDHALRVLPASLGDRSRAAALRASWLSRFRHYNNLDMCERACARCSTTSASRRCAKCCARISKPHERHAASRRARHATVRRSRSMRSSGTRWSPRTRPTPSSRPTNGSTRGGRPSARTASCSSSWCAKATGSSASRR